MDDATLRQAIATAIYNGLRNTGGKWTAVLPNGKEVGFRPAGEFAVDLFDEETGEEQTYKFRIRVELAN